MCFHAVSQNIKDAVLGYFLIAVFEKTFMLLLNMKVHLLQKLRLSILKTSSQTELKGPVDNLIYLTSFSTFTKRKKLHCLQCLAATKRNWHIK